MTSAASSQDSLSKPTPPSSRRLPVRILVCEDQDSIRRMIETLVSARGYEVVSVPSGSRALAAAQNGGFDVVLLDLMLPGELDGFQVCERLRAAEPTRAVPILVLSALDDADSRRRATAAGASAFYAKPFSPMALLRELEQLRDRGSPPSSGSRARGGAT